MRIPTMTETAEGKEKRLKAPRCFWRWIHRGGTVNFGSNHSKRVRAERKKAERAEVRAKKRAAATV